MILTPDGQREQARGARKKNCSANRGRTKAAVSLPAVLRSPSAAFAERQEYPCPRTFISNLCPCPHTGNASRTFCMLVLAPQDCPVIDFQGG